MIEKPNRDEARSLVGKRVLFSENDFSDDGLFEADVLEASPTGAHLRVRYLNGSMKWITASSLGSRGWYVREVLGIAAPAVPDNGEMRIPIYAARGIGAGSWLNDPEYADFRRRYEYAATQTRAIPALAKLSAEEVYWLLECSTPFSSQADT